MEMEGSPESDSSPMFNENARPSDQHTEAESEKQEQEEQYNNH